MEILKNYLQACADEGLEKNLEVYEELISSTRTLLFRSSVYQNSLLSSLESLRVENLQLQNAELSILEFNQICSALYDSLKVLNVAGNDLKLNNANLSKFSQLQELNLSNNEIIGPISLPKTLKRLTLINAEITSLLLAEILQYELFYLNASNNPLKQNFEQLFQKMEFITLKVCILENCGLDRECIQELKTRVFTYLDISMNQALSNNQLQESEASNEQMLLQFIH